MDFMRPGGLEEKVQPIAVKPVRANHAHPVSQYRQCRQPRGNIPGRGEVYQVKQPERFGRVVDLHVIGNDVAFQPGGECFAEFARSVE